MDALENKLRTAAAGALVGTDLARWERAGRPLLTVGEQFLRARACATCPDRVCAGCWRTAIYRWLPTQGCPLGIWDGKIPSA